jgi:hypothetical protein
MTDTTATEGAAGPKPSNFGHYAAVDHVGLLVISRWRPHEPSPLGQEAMHEDFQKLLSDAAPSPVH